MVCEVQCAYGKRWLQLLNVGGHEYVMPRLHREMAYSMLEEKQAIASVKIAIRKRGK
jgi:hypothetical protein